MSKPAASLTPLTSWSAALSMTLGGTEADCARIERSTTLPRIQPENGQRFADDEESPTYNAISMSLAAERSLCREAPCFVRSLGGKRTEIEDKIVRPVLRTCSPRRDIASASTVVAGRTSVSMATGETLGSITRMSGRRSLPFNMPVFSEVTTLEVRQTRRVFLNSAATASLIVDRPWVIGHSGEGIRPHAASAT